MSKARRRTVRQQRRPHRQGDRGLRRHAQPDGLRRDPEDPGRPASTSSDIGPQKTKAQTGFANWFQDFPHLLNFSFLVDGDSIQDTNNQNFGNVDDPSLNKTINELTLELDLPSVADRWEAWMPAPLRRRAAMLLRTDIANWRPSFPHPDRFLCDCLPSLYNNDYSTFKLK